MEKKQTKKKIIKKPKPKVDYKKAFNSAIEEHKKLKDDLDNLLAENAKYRQEVLVEREINNDLRADLNGANLEISSYKKDNGYLTDVVNERTQSLLIAEDNYAKAKGFHVWDFAIGLGIGLLIWLTTSITCVTTVNQCPISDITTPSQYEGRDTCCMKDTTNTPLQCIEYKCDSVRNHIELPSNLTQHFISPSEDHSWAFNMEGLVDPWVFMELQGYRITSVVDPVYFDTTDNKWKGMFGVEQLYPSLP